MTGVVAAQLKAAGVEHVFREAYGAAVATLVRMFGDITLAEDAVQDAFVVASDRWRSDGIPPNPVGWITLRPHGTGRSMIFVVRPVVGHSMNNSAPAQPLRAARARRSAERTDRCGTTNSD